MDNVGLELIGPGDGVTMEQVHRDGLMDGGLLRQEWNTGGSWGM